MFIFNFQLSLFVKKYVLQDRSCLFIHCRASEPASEPDVPPPRYSSQSSLEKKALTASEDGSETGSGSDYSDSETGTGSDYSDEEQGSYYSDEEKKRDSEEDEEEEEDISTFV